MNQDERMYESMYEQTKRHMDAYPDKWSAVQAIVRYKNGLDENLQAIREKDLQANGTTRGLTITKQDLKNQLALKAAILCGAMYAWASETDNQELLVQSDYSPTALYKLADTEFAQAVKVVTDLATSHLVALADQAVTEDQITEVATSLDDFSEMIGLPRTRTIRTSTAGTELDQLIKSTNSLLKDKLDKAMLRYRLIDTPFYEGYQRARMLVN